MAQGGNPAFPLGHPDRALNLRESRGKLARRDTKTRILAGEPRMEDELMERRHFLTSILGLAWALTVTWLISPVSWRVVLHAVGARATREPDSARGAFAPAAGTERVTLADPGRGGARRPWAGAAETDPWSPRDGTGETTQAQIRYRPRGPLRCEIAGVRRRSANPAL